MSDQTTAAEDAPASDADDGIECDYCAGDHDVDCSYCQGSGQDEFSWDGYCRDCGGSGQSTPDHCCDCGGSPYCQCCPKCGNANMGVCTCPIPVTGADGQTLAVL